MMAAGFPRGPQTPAEAMTSPGQGVCSENPSADDPMGLSAPRTCRSVSLAGGALMLRLPALTCRVNPGEFACALSPAGDAHSPRGQPTGAPLSCVCHSGRRLRVGDWSLAGTAPGMTCTPHATGPLRGRAEGGACGPLAGLRSQVSRERHPKAVGRERAGEQPLPPPQADTTD